MDYVFIFKLHWLYDSAGFIYKLSLKLRWSLCDFIWVGRFWLLQNKLITRVAGSVYSSVMFVNVNKKHYIGYIRNEYISVNEIERVNENWCHFCDLCTKFSRSNQFRTKPCPTELTKPYLHFYVIYHSAEK